MSSIEENEDQIAYQAAVNINGHIFKGILYDQGDNHEYNYMNGGDHDSSSGGDPVPRQYNLNITRTATSAANDAAVGGGGVASAVAAEGTSHFLETSLYSSVNTFVAGTQFFPPSRS
ncbi:hypothetical protein EJD97_000278 [Solanum chilense]|uniref:Uncharacterized protein n=1 Tax=Solanum chilense TaxID=4083 RepID=A0A6N2AND4_SOLCI|nr:hypothetical protein EJD97_000278 [Solanum chilense]